MKRIAEICGAMTHIEKMRLQAALRALEAAPTTEARSEPNTQKKA